MSKKRLGIYAFIAAAGMLASLCIPNIIITMMLIMILVMIGYHFCCK